MDRRDFQTTDVLDIDPKMKKENMEILFGNLTLK